MAGSESEIKIENANLDANSSQRRPDRPYGTSQTITLSENSKNTTLIKRAGTTDQSDMTGLQSVEMASYEMAD